MQNLLTFYSGKRVAVTGHTGFKGSWLTLWLSKLGADVAGYSLPPSTRPNLFDDASIGDRCRSTFDDIRDRARLQAWLLRVEPDVVFHLAAQPLVRQSYADPVGTFETNTLGTLNVLEAIRATKRAMAVVVVTTDKVYENREWDLAYREPDELGGYDAYSASKAAAELVIASYRRSFFPKHTGVLLASARAGNVVGGGDWAADRIIPDCIRALAHDEPIRVRSPRSVRPWQHVLESLHGYLVLGAMLASAKGYDHARAYNFGPGTEPALDVGGVVQTVIEAWGAGEWLDESDPHAVHEAGQLRLSIERAVTSIPWRPRWTAREAIRRSTAWYRGHHEGRPAQELCLSDLTDYLAEP